MRQMNRLCLIALVAAIATTLATGSAWADEIENDAGSFTGHANLSLASGAALYVTGGGNITCNTVSGEGTIDNENVPNNATTEVGSLESLVFSHSGSIRCPTNIFGVSTCIIGTNGLPYDLSVRENGATDEVLITNIELGFACETFLGTVICHYNTAEQSGTVTGAARETAVFNDSVTGEMSNSFVCPGSGTFQAALQLKDESGDEIMLTEN